MKNYRAFFLVMTLFFPGSRIFGTTSRPLKDTVPVFDWYFIHFGPDSNETRVFIVVSGNSRKDTLELGSFASQFPGSGSPFEADTAITGTILQVATGWWAGGGDAVVLVKLGGRYLVYWQEIYEETGWLPAKLIGEIILPSSPGKKPSFTKPDR